MNFAAIKQAISSAASSQEVAHTNATAIVGISAATAASTISVWLQVIILFGTALSIFVKLALDLRKRSKAEAEKEK